MRRVAAMLALGFASMGLAADEAAIPPFSTATPGERMPAGWSTITLPYGPKPQFRAVREGDATVVRVATTDSFGMVSHVMSADPKRTPLLAWRWKIDRVVDKARLEAKDREDFAARVYVAFDYPESQLPLSERTKLAAARAFYPFVPAAAICYVWDNTHSPGTAAWSPHMGHVRVVVVESGAARAGQWIEEQRDVEADFVAAFGRQWTGRVPRVVAVVAGNDTDQTEESATVWFGDFRLGARP
ncbi:MAG TPA: DUF3047 domain-containing protein [Usitatibacter sp.]|nr:DUF3047 domain-containing protein [Usitatibacter sp.]